MDIEKRVKRFTEFFEKEKREKLISSIQKQKGWIKIQFSDIIKFDPDLAEDLIDDPEETLKTAEVAIESLSALGDTKGISMRVVGLLSSNVKSIWKVRGDDLGKFMGLRGVINKCSDVTHITDTVDLMCKSCSATKSIKMFEGEWKEPRFCTGCQTKNPGWNIVGKPTTYDIIKMGIIDDLMEESNEGRSMAREKLVLLSRDLTSREIDKEIKPGRQVIVNGYLKYKQKMVQGQKSAELSTEFIANSVEFVKVGWETVPISLQEEKLIEALSKQENIIDRLAFSAVDVEGHDDVKKICLLLLAGAPSKYEKSGQLKFRGTVHVLLIGNPGTSKTYIAKRFGRISPIYSFQSAATASGKGLIASVAQDKDLGSWVIYPGVVAMCHKGTVVLDELDKTNEEDYGDHNHAMNDMIVPLARANVKGRLDTETCYLATANPENRVFTRYESFYNQIAMPKDFLDRFDMIMPMENPVEEQKKHAIVNIMLERHVDENEKIASGEAPEFDEAFIRKYIAFCRRFEPRLDKKKLGDYINQRLLDMMKVKYSDDEKDSELHHQISFRHLESILRFAYASARLRLRDITKDDIDLAFDLKRQSFLKLGIIDEQTGTFNWAKLENIDEKVISEKEEMHGVVKSFFSKMDIVPIQDVIEEAKNKGIDIEDMEKYLQDIKKKGDYYEPRPGYLKKL